jgi:hypothetical protein
MIPLRKKIIKRMEKLFLRGSVRLFAKCTIADAPQSPRLPADPVIDFVTGTHEQLASRADRIKNYTNDEMGETAAPYHFAFSQSGKEQREYLSE